MYGTTLAHALSLRPPSPYRTTCVFTTLGITAIISWPFAAVLAVPYALKESVQTDLDRKKLVDVIKGAFMAIIYVLSVLVSNGPLQG
jgi:hypothetical protein